MKKIQGYWQRWPAIRGGVSASESGRAVCIAVTSGVVATMTMLGIVGWNGGHPSAYYWAIVVTLTVSCILGCKRFAR
jgi:hypothetical protein